MSLVERRRADIWFATLTLLLGAVEIATAFGGPLDLAADESHYWEWARRLDWSYYSKGPLIAYLIAGSRALFGDTELAVRFPAVLCFNLFSFIFYFFLRRQVLPIQALWGWVAMRSMLIIAQMGVVMTTDAPAALFWLMAVVGAHRALLQENYDGWLLFGLCAGLGMLAKYTVGILVPSVVILLVLTPLLRHHLRNASFWIGVAIFGVLLLPIVAWNIEHGWVNVAHNMTHLATNKSRGLTLRYFGELVLGQIGLVGPVIFVGIGMALARALKLWRSGDIEAGLFFWTTIPLAAVCVVVSLTKHVYENWPMPIYIGGVLAACHVFARGFTNDRRSREWIRGGILLSMLLTGLAHLPMFGISFGIPPKYLPTKKLAGWSRIGDVVETELNVLRATEHVEPVVVADEYQLASSAAFYARSHPQVLCAVLAERRMNQYDIWDGWEQIKGRPAVVVVSSPDRLAGIRGRFQRTEPPTEPLPTTIEYLGREIRRVWIIRGYGYNGEPFPPPAGR